MSERRDELARIKQELEEYVKIFCPCSEGGEFTDFSGEKCNDAFIMLQQALNSLGAES